MKLYINHDCIDLEEEFKEIEKLRVEDPNTFLKSKLSLVEIIKQLNGFLKIGEKYPINADWKRYSFNDNLWYCNRGYGLMLYEKLEERFKNPRDWVVNTEKQPKISGDKNIPNNFCEVNRHWEVNTVITSINSIKPPKLSLKRIRRYGIDKTFSTGLASYGPTRISGGNFDYSLYSFSILKGKREIALPQYSMNFLNRITEENKGWAWWLNKITQPLFFELSKKLKLNLRN